MKPAILFFIFTIAASTSHSQAIHFSNLSFRDALTKARKENKMLFIEMFTPWCTYCKQMERDVFTTTGAGDYYNAHFINVRYDALKTDGIQIRKSYATPGFPTFLYLDPNGFVLVKTTGYQPTQTFISNADSATTIRKSKEQLQYTPINPTN